MDITGDTIELRAEVVPFTRTHVVAETVEQPSLQLRPLKKHTNIRLGKKIDLTGYPSKTSLFTISNKHGWFFAGHEHTIRASPVSELRTALAQNSTEEEAQFLCQVKLDVAPEIPLFVSLADEESKLVAASKSAITVWDITKVINGDPTPLHTFRLDNLIVVDVLPNPGENPETVAFLTTGQSQDEPCVLLLYNCVNNNEIVRWSGVAGNGNAPLAAAWSSRGKQISIALSSGHIVQYSPSAPSEAKATIPRAEGPNLEGTIPLSLQWLSNTVFYVIYAQPRSDGMEDYEPEQYNYIISYDKNANHAIDTELPLPWDPYGLQREPGHLIANLRPWGNLKNLLFVNDAHASDVGIVACLGDSTSDDAGRWIKLSLGEESITFPLTSDMDDTSLVGMSVDLTATQPLLASSQANGDDPAIPPSPILYMMTNDAVIVAFHIINEEGGAYPGMGGADSNASEIRGGTEQGMDIGAEKSEATTPMQAERPVAPQPSAQPQATSAFGASVPAAPAFGSTGFGFGNTSAPKFGSSGFGSTPTTSPFATAASNSSSTGSGFASTGPTLGFGAFSANKPSFGASTFGSTPSQPAFGQSSFGAPASNSSASPSPFAPKSAATTPSSFGNSSNTGGGFASFAGNKPTFAQPSFGTSNSTSAFGSATATSAFGSSPFAAAVAAANAKSQPTSTTTSPPQTTPAQSPPPAASAAAQSSTPASVFKPSGGFGAFSQNNASAGSSIFSNPKPVTFDGKSTAFAAAGAPVAASPFGANAGTGAPKFGASGFGQSGFAQSKFGQSSFGQGSSSTSAFANPGAYSVESKPSTGGGGGFGSFAGAATSFAALAGQAQSNKPAFAEAGEQDKIKKDTGPVLGSASEAPKAEASKFNAIPAKTAFGTNPAAPKFGFGGSLKPRTGGLDDEEDDAGKSGKERFPEDESDKLEPKTIFTGPGLFGEGGSSSSNKQSGVELKGFSSLGLDSKKSSETATVPSVKSAFSSVPASTTPKKAADEEEENESDKEDSADLEDDTHEFLSEGDEEEDQVDLTGEYSAHTFDDEEGDEEVDEDDEEDEDEDEDEEDDSDVPQDATPTSSPPRGRVPETPPRTESKPTPFNPFGKAATPAGSVTPAKSTSAVPSKPSTPPPAGARASPFGGATTSTTPAPSTPSLLTRLGPQTAEDSPTKPKAKPASPKAAFGSWGASATSSTQVQKTPPAVPQFGSTGQPATTSTRDATRAFASPAPPASVTPPKPEVKKDEVQAKRPLHPELQEQLDRILINYQSAFDKIAERSRKIRAAFDMVKAAFTGESPASMSLANMQLMLRQMNEASLKLGEKMVLLQQRLSDVQGAGLKAEMKREEVIRYIEARKDPHFMENLVKPRGLGPEHTENRTRLRKAIQLESERLKEVDEHVKRLKRKVELYKAGNVSYQPPNLDHVRGTCQNIDLYISAMNKQITQLSSRIEALPSPHEDQDSARTTGRELQRLSSSTSRLSQSRTSSADIAPEMIASTVEVFAGEVKMTRLKDIVVQTRQNKPAPLSKPVSHPMAAQLKESGREGALLRTNPFGRFKTMVLKDVNSLRSAYPTSQGRPPTNVPTSVPNNPLSQPAASQPNAETTSPDPASSPPVSTGSPSARSEAHRRNVGPGGAGRHHAKAVPINRERQPVVQDTGGFSFGPPPSVANPLPLPSNFISLTGKK